MRAAPAALLVSLALARAAVAQPPPAARKAEAERRFREAESLYKRRDYLAAAAEYQAAYDLSGLAGLLYNVAQSYRLGGEKARAVEAYRLFLERAPDHQLAPLARVHVDSLERELAAERRPAEEPPPPPPATSTASRTDAVVTAAPTPTPGRGHRFKTAGLVSGGIGLVALGAAVHFGIEARKASDAISHNREGWSQSLLDRYDEGQAAETRMFVLSGVGAAALAAGGVLYYLGWRADRAEVVPITPAGDGVGAALVGRF